MISIWKQNKKHRIFERIFMIWIIMILYLNQILNTHNSINVLFENILINLKF